ncbi:MAG TPA: hypothetical protein VJJ75_00800 [Candidatus Nanoarchaeia archaeon]|nr:hypothetical protein [Candidatus Nanoarchaeia archaeon]
MANTLKFHYDEEGDFLEITSGDISKCFFDNVGDGIFEIIDKKTRELRGVAVFSFKARTKDLKDIQFTLPLKLVRN